MRQGIDLRFRAPVLQGTSVVVPILVQSTILGAPMLVQGIVLPPVTRAPIHTLGPPFKPGASAPMLIPGTAGAPVPIQGTVLPPMTGAQILSQDTPFPGAYMASLSWPLCMPNLLPRAQVGPPTALSERELFALHCEELEARELAVERKLKLLI